MNNYQNTDTKGFSLKNSVRSLALGFLCWAIVGTFAPALGLSIALAEEKAEEKAEEHKSEGELHSNKQGNKQAWSFRGIFGYFDKPSLRRGYEVYDQVCASCHSLRFLHYRDLTTLGYSREQVAALAARFEVEDGPNDEGEYYARQALPSDPFVSPFANDAAARAVNNGALPLDLSLIVTQKAGEGGADYIYALLTGYSDPPAGVEIAEGLYYNKALATGGHAEESAANSTIAMPQPLFKGMISYSDGENASVERMAHDVAQFLVWTSDPSLETRKRMGLRVVIFLAAFFVVAFLYKRRVWARVR